MTRLLDRILWLLKWPLAVIGFLFLPGMLLAFFGMLKHLAAGPRALIPFLVGFGAFVGAWYVALERRSAGRFLGSMEHELTHALFAALTLHRVPGFLRAWRSGGHIRYAGRGNWLIAISPFFCPTLSLLVAVLLHALPLAYVRYAGGLLGATLAYHLLTTWPEAHRHHSDIREANWLFCLVFLPPANAFVIGSLLALVTGGGRAWPHYLHDAFAHTVGFAHLVWS